MDTFCTPKSAMSSVFLTPPFSSGRSNQESCTNGLGTSIPLPNFLNLTSEREEEVKTDIISFLSGPFPEISLSILSLLKPSDLSTCLAVSKSWRSIVLSHKPFRECINDYRIEKRKEQENMYMKQLNNTSSPPLTPRLPLHTLPTNSFNPPTTAIPPLPLPSTEITKLTEPLRPCPQCSSPAKSINKTRSLCNYCHFDFCPRCFKPAHTQHTCSVNVSPKKRQSSIACSKSSKRRLRRL